MISTAAYMSVIPETHIIRGSDAFKSRTDAKQKEFVSLVDDDSYLEWKVSRVHESQSSCASQIWTWMNSSNLNTTICCTGGASEVLLSKPRVEFLESVCSGFLSSKPLGQICGSVWTTSSEFLEDILRPEAACDHPAGGVSVDVVPETESVRIRSALDFQRLLRRIEHSLSSSVDALFLRFVLFSESKIVHFVFLNDVHAVKNLGPIPSCRVSRKSGTTSYPDSMNLTQRCLSPLLAGNAKPFIVIDTSSASEENILTFQSLFDIGEKMCLTALPCEPEPTALRIEDFEILDSMDKVPPRKPLDVKNAPSTAPKVKVHLNGPKPRKPKKETPDVMNQLDELEREIGSDVLGYEKEIEGLRTQNMVLKCEVDKLSATSSADGGNAYTSHLVTEVKQLRAELLSVENDRRKYETSKRLVESLIEKSNKLKAEVGSKSAKIEQLREQETVYKSELSELKKNCEYLLETNRSLNLELENARSSKLIRKPETSIESFYHDFLFPFNRKKEMGKAILTIHESLQRIERSVAVNAPSSVLDVRRSLSTLDKLKDCINELVSAGEKLEISAVTLIKQKTGKLN